MITCKLRSRMLVVAAFGAVFLNQTAVASTTLYSIGPDPGTGYVPRDLQAIDPVGPTNQTVFQFGDGSMGFSGGLAYTSSNGFYVISQDNLGNSVLNQFAVPGAPAAALFTLGTGFNGGMAFDSSDGLLYAIADDGMGTSSLYRLNLLGGNAVSLFSLGTGFSGGLAFDSNTGLFYAIASDLMGNSTLYSISLGGTVTALPINLGQGYTGGLTYDSVADRFYAIGSDTLGNSNLVDFTLLSNAPHSIGGLGPGFINAALTIVPDGGAPNVPEPAGFGLIGVGLSALGWMQIRRKTRP